MDREGQMNRQEGERNQLLRVRKVTGGKMSGQRSSSRNKLKERKRNKYAERIHK